MLSSSERFAEGVVYGYDVATRCDVVDSRNTHVVKTLDVIGGAVSVDIERKTRRQCSLTLQDPEGELVPDEVTDYLQPYSGYYLNLYRGAQWRDGTKELFPLGTFAPYNPKVKDSEDGLEITLEGYDRSKIISRIRWIEPFTIPSGTKTTAAVKMILDSRMSGLKYNLEPSNATVPLTVLGTEADNDPWDDAVKIANSDGMDLYVDANDVVVMCTIPDTETDPIVHEFIDNERCTMTDLVRSTDASQMYTGVIVYSEGTEVTAPIRVAVWLPYTDLRIPYFFPTSLIKTTEQAIKTAESLLRRVGKAEFNVDISAIPDPRIEAGDVVRVTRARSKTDHPFVISNINLPLDSVSEMSVATAQRRGP